MRLFSNENGFVHSNQLGIAPDKMQALYDYFFPKSTVIEQTQDVDIAVYITRGNTMTTIRLSYVKNLTDTKELYKLQQDIMNHTGETFDEEECTNGNIILEEIDKRLLACRSESTGTTVIQRSW